MKFVDYEGLFLPVYYTEEELENIRKIYKECVELAKEAAMKSANPPTLHPRIKILKERQNSK